MIYFILFLQTFLKWGNDKKEEMELEGVSYQINRLFDCSNYGGEQRLIAYCKTLSFK